MLELVRLGAYLRERLGPAFDGPLQAERFSSGQSNPTYRLRTDSGSYVLRRKPDGALLPSAHAVDREYRVIAALATHSDVPVPEPLLLCEDPGVIGSAFYVMEHVDGRVLSDPSLPGVAAVERCALYLELVRTIAALHRVDPAAIGLADYGRRGNYLARQIDRWSRQYRAVKGDRSEAVERLIDWLPRNVPADVEETRIVHGDYRLENVIFDPVAPRIRAVLDWELSTLGDPLADFAYFGMAWRLEPGLLRGLAGVDLAKFGIPDEAECLTAYCAAAGRPAVDHRTWETYVVFNMFRLAAILHGVGARARQGSASSANGLAMGALADPVAAKAGRLIDALEAVPGSR